MFSYIGIENSGMVLSRTILNSYFKVDLSVASLRFPCVPVEAVIPDEEAADQELKCYQSQCSQQDEEK